MQLTAEQQAVFKTFQLDDNNLFLIYTLKGKKKLKSVRARTATELETYIQNMANNIVKDMEDIKKYRANFEQSAMNTFNSTQIGDNVYWIEGYDCTLYQFAKVIKKTAKTITYQSYGYRGMNCTLKLKDTDMPLGEIFTKSYKYCLSKYNPNHNYDNNSD